jgi:hypothetical protein
MSEEKRREEKRREREREREESGVGGKEKQIEQVCDGTASRYSAPGDVAREMLRPCECLSR